MWWIVGIGVTALVLFLICCSFVETIDEGDTMVSRPQTDERKKKRQYKTGQRLGYMGKTYVVCGNRAVNMDDMDEWLDLLTTLIMFDILFDGELDLDFVNTYEEYSPVDVNHDRLVHEEDVVNNAATSDVTPEYESPSHDYSSDHSSYSEPSPSNYNGGYSTPSYDSSSSYSSDSSSSYSGGCGSDGGYD
jgi:hypothetical protein